MITQIISYSLVALVVGCTPLAPAVSMSLQSSETSISRFEDNLKVIKSRFVEYKSSGVFTEQEWNTFIEFDSTMTVVLLRYKTIVLSEYRYVSKEEVILLWNSVVVAYSKAREIVKSKWAKIPPETQEILSNLDERASVVSFQISEAVAFNDTEKLSEVVEKSLDVISLGMKLALVIL